MIYIGRLFSCYFKEKEKMMKKIITEERSFEKMFPLPARDMPTINKRTIMANLYSPYCK